MLLLSLMVISCDKNDEKIKLRITQMENEIKELKSEKYIKTSKIQALMSELSSCKESKVKFIEKKEDFDVIDSNKINNNKEKVTDTSKKDVNQDDSKKDDSTTNIVPQEKMNFLAPEDIKGKCQKSDINRVFHNLKPYFKKCFDNNNIKRGNIGFLWEINEDGKVVDVKLIKNNIFNKKLSNCLMIVLKSGRYNSPIEGTCKINYIFKL